MFKTLTTAGSDIVGFGRSIKEGGRSVFNKVRAKSNAKIIQTALVSSLYVYVVFLRRERKRVQQIAKKL